MMDQSMTNNPPQGLPPPMMNYIPPSMPPPTSLNPQQQQQQQLAPVMNTEQSSTIQYPPSAPTVSDTEASAASSNAQQQQQQQQIQQQQQMAAMMQMQQWNAAAAYAPPYMMGFPPGMMMMQPGMDRPASRQSTRPPSRQSVNAPVSSSRSLVNGQTGGQNQSSSLLPAQGYGNYMPPGMYNPWFDQYWQMMYAGYQNPYNFGYNDEMMKNYWKQGGYQTDDDRLSRHSAAVSQSKQSQHSSSIQTWGSRDSLNDEYYQMQNPYTNGYYPSKQPTMSNQVKRPARETTAPNTLLTTAGSANRQIPSTGPDAKQTFPSQNGEEEDGDDDDDDEDDDDDDDDDDEEEEESDDGSSDRFSIKSDLAQVNEDSSKALLAPLLYTRPHLRATFFFDQLVQVLPQSPSDTNQPAIVEIISANSVHSMAPSLVAERQLMSDFIGPLTSSTAKSNVIRYCERQSQLANKALHIIDRDALSILWQYMALLVKSNGLLDIRVDIPKILWSSGNTNTQTIDESSANSNHTQTSSSTATIENSLREFLALGEIDTSIKFACENQLFTHALIISYLTDRQLFEKTIHNIISNLDNGDVLKTFYELGAGSTPSVVTNVTKAHYGDWKRHLAVILANRTDTNAQFVDLCVKTMGDTLITSGRIYAGHFCYLIAGIPFGSYRNNADKIAVIGSIHAGQSNPSFASIPNLQLTEVYEYSIRKCLRNFIPLKIYYASKLVLHGLKREALAYCEEIGHSLIKEGNSAYAQLVDLQLFILIAEKSRAFSRNFQLDPTSYKEPTWLLELQRIIHSLTDNAFLNRTVRDESINSSYVQQPQQPTNLPISRVTNVQPSVEQAVANIQPPVASFSSTANVTNGYDQMNQQSSEQLTYQNQITNNYHNTLQVDTNVHYPTQVQPTYYEPPPQQPQQQQQQQQQPAQAYYQSGTQPPDTNNYSQQQQWAQQTTQSDHLNVSSQVTANNTSFYPTPSDQSTYIQPGFTSTPNPYASQQQQQPPTQPWYPSGQNEQQEQQQQLESLRRRSSIVTFAPQSNWQQQQQQQPSTVADNRKLSSTSTHSNTSSTSLKNNFDTTNFYQPPQLKRYSTNQTSSISEEFAQQPEQQQQQQQQTNGQPKKKHAIFDDSDDVFPNANKTTDNKSNAKTSAPAANQDGAGAGKTGFLGSLLGRVGFKRSAQAHLPDDKNRAFKFDEKTGRWIDTSKPADEQAASQVRPPPMMPSNNTSTTGTNNSAQSTAPPSFNPSMPPASSQPRTLSFAAGATTTTTTTNNHAVPPANTVTYPPQVNAPTQSAPLQPPTQTQLPQEQPQQPQQQQQKMPAKLSAAQQRLQEMRQQQAAALQNPTPPVASSNQFSLRNRPTQSRYVDVLASTKGAVAPTPNVSLNDLMPTPSTGVPSFAASNQPNNYFVPGPVQQPTADSHEQSSS